MLIILITVTWFYQWLSTYNLLEAVKVNKVYWLYYLILFHHTTKFTEFHSHKNIEVVESAII